MRLFFQEGSKLLTQLFLLMLVFVLIEISFFLQSLNFYFGDFIFIAHKLEVPATIFPGVLFFIASQALVHLGALFLLWFTTLALAFILKLSIRDRENLGVSLFILGLLTVLLLNQFYFPNSKFSCLSRFLIPDTLAVVLLFFLSCFWATVFVLTSLAGLGALDWRKRGGVFLISLGLFAYWGYQTYGYQSHDAATAEKPNIILIGVDSLRPDFLGYFGAPIKTSFIDHFLTQATVFSNTFTPLARTFPSWVTILSGVYPKESGIRFNLSKNLPNPKVFLLTTLLNQHGYHSIFATDETRFSNIDQRFAFDQVITPPMGLNDFLLGSFNDFPLSNLLINTKLGKWLFPHSFASRPVHVTYDPDSFLTLLKPYLMQDRQKPLFLAVHFCLPHYPYLWATYPGAGDKENVHRYQESILRVDQQLNDFMAMLDRYQMLKYAIVVLLSDHGEALELSGDRITSPLTFVSKNRKMPLKIPRFYPPSADDEAVDQSGGHGTDVLGFSQYHSLLAFKLYGFSQQAAKKISELSTLLDIKPTILDFLKIDDKNSGLSLKDLILGDKGRLPFFRRGIFLESDFSPEAVRSVHPEMRNLVFEGVELFKIDPQTTKIFVKETMGKMIISSKQYAIVDRDWVLALYPQENGKMIPVLVQLSTGKWTLDMSLPFAQKSPVKQLLYALRQFYGSDLKQA